jgi:hypothetical protein
MELDQDRVGCCAGTSNSTITVLVSYYLAQQSIFIPSVVIFSVERKPYIFRPILGHHQRFCFFATEIRTLYIFIVLSTKGLSS